MICWFGIHTSGRRVFGIWEEGPKCRRFREFKIKPAFFDGEVEGLWNDFCCCVFFGYPKQVSGIFQV